jgi:glyoxalase/bleomycin resistance protein/dioxygenase superfamily protein
MKRCGCEMVPAVRHDVDEHNKVHQRTPSRPGKVTLITGVHHFALTVSDADRSVDFYRGFGFEIVSDREVEGGYVEQMPPLAPSIGVDTALHERVLTTSLTILPPRACAEGGKMDASMLSRRGWVSRVGGGRSGGRVRV